MAKFYRKFLQSPLFTEKFRRGIYDMLVDAKKDREDLREDVKGLKLHMLETKEFSKQAADDRMSKDVANEDFAILNLPWKTIEEVEEAMGDEVVRVSKKEYFYISFATKVTKFWPKLFQDAFKRWLFRQKGDKAKGHPAKTLFRGCLDMPLRQRVYISRPRG